MLSFDKSSLIKFLNTSFLRNFIISKINACLSVEIYTIDRVFKSKLCFYRRVSESRPIIYCYIKMSLAFKTSTSESIMNTFYSSIPKSFKWINIPLSIPKQISSVGQKSSNSNSLF